MLAPSWTNAYLADGSLASRAFDGSGSSQPNDTLTFTYDALGRPDQTKRGSTVLTDYGWNPDGTLASRVDGTMGTTTFAYDWADRLTSLSAPLWSGSLNQSWANDGLLASRSWLSGAGGAAAYGYDAAKRPTTMTKSGTAAGSLAQTYDRDGNVTSESRSLTGVSGDAGSSTQTFSYDGLDRLASSSGLAAPATGYAYDRDGNRTAISSAGSTTTFAYDRTGALLSRTDPGGATSFAYDRYGNLTSAATAFNTLTAYAYDLGDRLTGLTPPSAAAAAYGFDALGRPASRTTASVVTTYSYAGASDTAWQLDIGGTLTRAVLDPDGARVAVKVGASTGFALPDLHGNGVALLNTADSAYLDAVRYDGYGATVDDAATGLLNPWAFQGRLQLSPDPDNPLYAAGARTYSPALGVFTALDSYAGSAASPISLNRYLYAGANPWTFIDPDGHAFIEGAGSGTLTQTQYQRQVAATIARAQAPARAAVQQARETDLATVSTPRDQGLVGWLHTGLDFAGFVPVAGGLADLANGGIYLLQGDAFNAGLSGLSAIPLAGDAFAAGRLAVKYGDDVIAGAELLARHGDEALDAVTHYGDDVTPLLAHGNSLTSAKPQHLYAITETSSSGISTVFKYGVSGGPISAVGQSYRAQRQIRALMRANPGVTYSADIVGHAANRVDVLAMERSAVFEHIALFGSRPAGNIRP